MLFSYIGRTPHLLAPTADSDKSLARGLHPQCWDEVAQSRLGVTGRNTFGTCFGETGLKIRPDVFRHDNWEQKKHVLLCKMSPASHFFLFEKGEKKVMKSVHSCREETLWQTFCPTSRSRCIFKNSDSCRHKVCDFMRSHAITCDSMRSNEIAATSLTKD